MSPQDELSPVRGDLGGHRIGESALMGKDEAPKRSVVTLESRFCLVSRLIRQAYFSTIGNIGARRSDFGSHLVAIELHEHHGRRRNDSLRDTHSRMPVVPDDELAREWLTAETLDPKAALAMLVPSESAATWTMRAVSARVGNVRNDDPALIKPAPDAQASVF